MIEKLLLNKLKKHCTEHGVTFLSFSVDFTTKKVTVKLGAKEAKETELEHSADKVVLGLLKTKVGVSNIDFLTGEYSAQTNEITLDAYFQKDGQKQTVKTTIK